MIVREKLDAIQWFPGDQHPAVKTSVLEAGMSRESHREIATQLDNAKGQLGAIRIAEWPRWKIVEPGDWILSRGGRYELVKQADFAARFEPVA